MGTKSTAFLTHKIYEPYRATRLWNEVVRAFRNDLPRGCHRRRMKSYEDCFVASEAVDWLLKYLQTSPHFGPDVCRQQAVQLLQKFLQCNLMEELSSRKSHTELKFQDDKTLYRVKKATPLKSPAPKCLKRMMRTPLTPLLSAHPNSRKPLTPGPDQSSNVVKNTLALLNENVPEPELQFQDHVPKINYAMAEEAVPKMNERPFQKESALSPQEIANIWKSVLWNKLSVTVALQNLEGILNPSQVLGQTIIHNVTNVQKNGIVTLLDKTDDIPNWILCAMKCLSKWPNTSGSSSCLPNYPGFEKDVFKVVQEYFLCLEEALIPCQFYGIVAALYSVATGFQKSEKLRQTNEHESLYVMPDSLSVSTNRSSNQIRALHRSELTCSDVHILQNPTHSSPLSSGSSDAVLELCQDRASYCFETAFSEEHPLTRIIRKPIRADSNTNTGMYKKCQSSENIHGHSDSNQITSVNRSESSDRISGKGGVVLPRKNSSLRWLSLDQLTVRNSKFQYEKRDKTRMGLKQVFYGKPFDPSNNTSKPVASDQSGSLDCISIGSSVISNISNQQNLVIRNPYINPSKPRNAVTRTHSVVSASRLCSKNATTIKEPARCSSALDKPAERQNNPVRNLSLPGSHRLVKCFQLVLLLLPATNRRKLHLLFRFLNKIKINRSLNLFPTEFAQILMVRMFWTSVLRASEGKDTLQEETLGCRVTEFLMDHCEAVLAPPTELQMEVENVVTLLCQSRMRHLGNEVKPGISYPVTYCEQVTSQMYEDQKKEILHSSLVELLEEIVRNPLLSKKERLNKLKKFQKQYPNVYKERFKTENEPEVKNKPTLLGMLRNLRF